MGKMVFFSNIHQIHQIYTTSNPYWMQNNLLLGLKKLYAQ